MNIILNADSYKYGMFNMYPANAETVYSYIESRGGEWDSTVFFGLQGFIKEYLLTPITQKDIDEAEEVIVAHGLPFYREGWEYILRVHNGRLPLVIKSVDEGSIIPTHNVLVTVENTDPKCWWLTTFIETALLRAVWYPTTVATNSYESKKLILKALEKTGSPALIDFKLHDFGMRGVSSAESAAIGGAAHLINFKGTDNINALMWIKKNYSCDMAGFSIPASEHSVITSWGQDREVDAYRNVISKHAKPGGLVACVSDSYDIYEACKLWGTVLKEDVLNSGVTLVVRPDSGNPSEVVLNCVRILETYFGSTKNEKGFAILNNVRVIQGDGIDHAAIRSILFVLELNGYSADNVSFGQGGGLLQSLDRDTLKFAMKASSISIRTTDGGLEVRDVFKNPVTDSGKKSKKGRVTLCKNQNQQYYTGTDASVESILETVFLNGELVKEITLEEVRTNTELPLLENATAGHSSSVYAPMV